MFGKIFAYIFLAVIIADIYIFAVFIRKLTKNILFRLLWFVPSLILLAGIYLFFFSGKGHDYREIFMFAFAGITLPKIFFTIISWLDIPFRYFFKWKVYPFTIVGLLVSFGIVYITIYGATSGKTRFEVKQIEFRSPNLPTAFDGYKVIQISDLHVGNWKGEKEPFRKLVEIINQQNGDVIMVTGDLVNTRAKELDGYEEILSGIKSRDGVYSILGNHDYGLYHQWNNKTDEQQNLEDLKKRQVDMGWILLNNEHDFLKKGPDSIAVIGVENAGSKFFPDFSDLSKATKGTESAKFKILLSHDPTHWRREVLNTNIDLMLAGHTHGTQLALGYFSIAQFVYPEWSGLYTKDKQGLYVNVGIGFVGLPFRYGAFPEITVITLKKE
ncbi:metallophosphoesterase [Dysgonomonas sp. OttesenSCG-928-M03]|nr:metallophosphoesterase [Dysgonomonas sp. OttesenSCG-928-M03]